MTANRRTTDRIKVIHGSVQTDRIGDIGRSRFKSLGRRLPLATFVSDGANHASAALPGRHDVEQFLAPIEHADAGRGGHLVTGEHIEIAAHGLHIDILVAGRLGAVHHGQCPRQLGFGAHLGGRINRTQRVGDMGEGDEFDVLLEEFIKRIQVETAFRVLTQNRNVTQGGARLLADNLPRHHIGVMLHLSADDHVARLEVVPGPTLGDEIYRSGGATGENNFG